MHTGALISRRPVAYPGAGHGAGLDVALRGLPQLQELDLAHSERFLVFALNGAAAQPPLPPPGFESAASVIDLSRRQIAELLDTPAGETAAPAARTTGDTVANDLAIDATSAAEHGTATEPGALPPSMLLSLCSCFYIAAALIPVGLSIDTGHVCRPGRSSAAYRYRSCSTHGTRPHSSCTRLDLPAVVLPALQAPGRCSCAGGHCSGVAGARGKCRVTPGGMPASLQQR